MITQIRFDERALQQRGLQTKELRGLGPLVVFAGPNGGGKTRHLDLVHEAAMPSAVGTYQHQIEETTGGTSLYAVQLRYVPNAKQVDPATVSQAASNALLEHIAAGEYGAVTEGLSVYLDATARALWNHAHPHAEQFPTIATEYDEAIRFNHVLKQLLGFEITPMPSPYNATWIIAGVFGRPYDPRVLSVGQHVLLCWAILLTKQSAHYKNRIVLLDEPEVYLHPDICVRAVRALQEVLGPHGQVWVATHSLPFIAWAGAGSLYFVQDGQAQYAGTARSRIWRSLLGGDEVRDTLIGFLDGDAAAAVTRFASECLLAPQVASDRPDDPQPRQFAPVVMQRLRSNQPTRILEIGAGRGRLVHAILEAVQANTALPVQHLSYTAYQDRRFINPQHRTECEAQLSALRSIGVHAQYSTNFADSQALESTRADVVVLANTLHEIPVEDWLSLFGNICRASNPNATLLVIEDQEPSVGELPHARGFLILDRNEWSAIVDADPRTSGDRRLTAFTIPVDLLKKVTSQSLQKALKLVRQRAVSEAEHLRSENDNSHRSGRRHAFYAMLHLNATLALRIFQSDHFAAEEDED